CLFIRTSVTVDRAAPESPPGKGKPTLWPPRPAPSRARVVLRSAVRAAAASAATDPGRDLCARLGAWPLAASLEAIHRLVRSWFDTHPLQFLPQQPDRAEGAALHRTHRDSEALCDLPIRLLLDQRQGRHGL